MVHQQEPKCRANRLVGCLPGQGHVEDSCNQNKTVYQFDATPSLSKVSCKKIGLLCLRPVPQRRLKTSVSVRPDITVMVDWA